MLNFAAMSEYSLHDCNEEQLEELVGKQVFVLVDKKELTKVTVLEVRKKREFPIKTSLLAHSLKRSDGKLSYLSYKKRAVFTEQQVALMLLRGIIHNYDINYQEVTYED